MKFLTDENLPTATVKALRLKGFQIKDVKEENLEGSKDLQLANLANEESRIIITLDHDFAKLFKKGVLETGVILIWHKRHKAKQITERILKFLQSVEDKDILDEISIVE